MSRDWSKEKSIALATASFGGVVEAKKLVDAIAEIEQLRQDKAELVETMTQLAGAFEQLAKRPKVFISWKSYTIWHDANILVAKHGGEPK